MHWPQFMKALDSRWSSRSMGVTHFFAMILHADNISVHTYVPDLQGKGKVRKGLSYSAPGMWTWCTVSKLTYKSCHQPTYICTSSHTEKLFVHSNSITPSVYKNNRVTSTDTPTITIETETTVLLQVVCTENRSVLIFQPRLAAKLRVQNNQAMIALIDRVCPSDAPTLHHFSLYNSAMQDEYKVRYAARWRTKMLPCPLYRILRLSSW